ncbi:hypothetical protein BDV95DRAFT_652148 [Massariosphaeria phaeospora]|uniref:Pal1 cell morphology protein-domain-containing protein n=1 Tax=Massariosphaeria phaeospora TaxID=100035 RepID=A0A7C8M2H0_9PLEO|nr:hypothetical protein BDV95DRAFT_652148 [Massariosphaeria phaeospora]
MSTDPQTNASASTSTLPLTQLSRTRASAGNPKSSAKGSLETMSQDIPQPQIPQRYRRRSQPQPARSPHGLDRNPQSHQPYGIRLSLSSQGPVSLQLDTYNQPQPRPNENQFLSRDYRHSYPAPSVQSRPPNPPIDPQLLTAENPDTKKYLRTQDHWQEDGFAPRRSSNTPVLEHPRSLYTHSNTATRGIVPAKCVGDRSSLPSQQPLHDEQPVEVNQRIPSRRGAVRYKTKAEEVDQYTINSSEASDRASQSPYPHGPIASDFTKGHGRNKPTVDSALPDVLDGTITPSTGIFTFADAPQPPQRPQITPLEPAEIPTLRPRRGHTRRTASMSSGEWGQISEVITNTEYNQNAVSALDLSGFVSGKKIGGGSNRKDKIGNSQGLKDGEAEIHVRFASRDLVLGAAEEEGRESGVEGFQDTSKDEETGRKVRSSPAQTGPGELNYDFQFPATILISTKPQIVRPTTSPQHWKSRSLGRLLDRFASSKSREDHGVGDQPIRVTDTGHKRRSSMGSRLSKKLGGIFRKG